MRKISKQCRLRVPYWRTRSLKDSGAKEQSPTPSNNMQKCFGIELVVKCRIWWCLYFNNYLMLWYQRRSSWRGFLPVKSLLGETVQVLRLLFLFSLFFMGKKKNIVCILHRMIGWFGLEVAQRSPSTVSCHGQGYLLLDQVAQKPVWSDFKHFQWWGIYCFSRLPRPVPHRHL